MSKRIHILGSPGAGKSTLARKLAKDLRVPHIDLDDELYPIPMGEKTPIPKRAALVKKLSDKKGWVVEGIYSAPWAEELYKKADQIIFLDTPLLLSLLRITKRYFRHVIKGDEKYGLLQFLRLFFNTIRYHYPIGVPNDSHLDKHTTKQKTLRALKPHTKKLVIK
jgi:adenylate kinase family enzyme